ncbi:hypothetical protein [uncultured Hyphomonas sp.]|uniref:hypothetical protein n=1 Tax=uncultured Hyphomonas sp. TaxID=225298 RepID=UPI002AAB9243|nr:hypothetical protein [uncultured Hyphomonas sp.]
MDILDHYLAEEGDHLPLLLDFLEYPEGQSRGTCFSNLFNFRADFENKVVTIEDDCGLFCGATKQRRLSIDLDTLRKRLGRTGQD